MKKIETITANLNRFEGLIKEFRTGFVEKIYRDHINHMLRTALMASFLAYRLRFSRVEIRKLIAAALFHDTAYPVQEAEKLFKLVNAALGEGYTILTIEDRKPVLGKRPIQILRSTSGSNLKKVSKNSLCN